MTGISPAPLGHRGSVDVSESGSSIFGANTSRLLVASYQQGRVEAILKTRTPTGLGAEIEARGKVSKAKLRQVVRAVEGAVAAGRDAGASEIFAFVTSPGRQSRNGSEKVAAVGSATGISVRLLTAAEEGRLAYRGARDSIEGTVLVGDIGGGSIQIALGEAREHPVWAFSANVGSLRLTRRHITHDPPRRSELKALRQSAEEALSQLDPTEAAHVLVTGGTARALRRVVGRTLGHEELEAVIKLIGRQSAKKLAREYGLSVWRAEILAAGAVLAHTLSERLQHPLEVADNGIREGAIIDLLEAGYRSGPT